MNISAEDIIKVNQEATGLSKEPHGILKHSIEAAIHRTEYYDTKVEKAAALFHSIINNHYFVQANKRTAMVVLLRYLGEDRLDESFVEELVMDTVNKQLSVEDIAERIQKEIVLREDYNVSVQEIFQKYEKLIEKLINM